MSDRLVVGQIAKAQGIRGELKVKPLTDDPDRFFELKSVIIDGITYKITSARVSGEIVFLMLEGVCDRNSAERLHGKMLEIERSQAKKLDEDTYFIVDLLGCQVFVDDASIGVLEDVGQYGAADVHTVLLPNGRRVRYPFLKKLVKDIDLKAKRIFLDGRVFEEVSVNED